MQVAGVQCRRRKGLELERGPTMSRVSERETGVPRLFPLGDGLRLVLETALDAVVVMKPDGSIVDWNDRAAEVFGWSQEEALGRDMAGLIIPERFHNAHRNGIRRYLESGKAEVLGRRIEVAGVRSNGEEFPVELSIAPIQDSNSILFVGFLRDITERKRAEERVRVAEQELRATIDTIPALVARHRADGVIDFVNQTWRSYAGLTQESWRDGNNIHPDDRSLVEQAWLAALATGEPFETEQRLRRADGEYRWHLIRRVPLCNENGAVIAWYEAGYDVHDRKLAETALRASEAQLADAQRELQLIVDSIPAMVGTFEPDGRRSFVNQTWREYTGLTGEEGNTVYFHPDDLERYERALRTSIATGAPLVVDVRARAANGEYRWHTHRRVPRRNERGEIVKWYSVGTDVHDQRIAEEALNAAQTALAHASRVTTLGEISATIAHEVNQPLTAIVANGHACQRFLRREIPDLDGVRGAVEWIVKEGNRAGEIIQRVRGLLKKAGPHKIALDVNEIITEVAALLQRELTAQQVTPHLELAPAIPLSIGDRVQIQQVIINLVMNGVEAMRSITERPHALVIRSYEDEARRVVVAVRDSGVGITTEAMSRLFDAFFSTKPSGLGLGLSICRSIIEDHGGRIWATNHGDGQGAIFQFALPPYQSGAA
jgi:PAS domain S-box-containing protein